MMVKAFGLNISVKLNPELEQEANELDKEEIVTGGNENRKDVNE